MFPFGEDSKLEVVVFIIGLFVVGRFILYQTVWLIRCIYVFFLSKTLSFKKYGKWAVVTGATDGIGKAYAQQLAKKGMSIVLVSRSIEKLEELASQLKDTYKVETKVIAVDFSRDDVYDHITSELKDLEIGMLVNNVGMSYSHPQYFHEVSSEDVAALIHVNCLSLVEMIKIVLPHMLKRKKGIIINIGSMAGAMVSPLNAEYSGTKAFVDFFTKCIQYEYSKESVIIQHVAPGFVATKMSKLRPSFFCPSPQSYVSSALTSVGKFTDTYGCFAHELFSRLLSIIPNPLLIYLNFKIMKVTRAKALKKKQKAK